MACNLRLLLLGVALHACFALSPRCASGERCPHIITVVIDDLGWNNVPWHNPSLASLMPNSLQLVREGVELDRHYASSHCSPSLSSLQSGRLPYHVNQVSLPADYDTAGVDRRMTTIPGKLKQAGYATHMAGKWDVGLATPDHTPSGRGFDTSLGYFSSAEDHYTQRLCVDAACELADNDPRSFVDLWETDRPAHGRNGTYGDKMYIDFALQTLQAHPLEQPIFLYIALQNNHEPLQVPEEFLERIPAEWTYDRRHYAAMGAYWDEALGNLTRVLRERGMWEHTLLMFTADNGGPVYPSLSPSHAHCGGANNWPLFGGKMANWEGGVRVSSFVSGGFLPPRARGTKQEGNVHIVDWYATFASLAGVDPADNVPGVPPVDAVDMWPLLSGATASSPRKELPLSVDAPVGLPVRGTRNVSALIVGDFKLLAGAYPTSIRQQSDWPTERACCNFWCWGMQVADCGPPEAPTCLYNIREDPGETRNLAAERPDVVAELAARLVELRQDVYYPQRDDVPNPEAQRVWREVYKGFVGPWKDLRQDHIVV